MGKIGDADRIGGMGRIGSLYGMRSIGNITRITR
tara:strand:+ start:121 stop:222 length:102 start_codon:yes stop_codon:yes gene_type:complete